MLRGIFEFGLKIVCFSGMVVSRSVASCTLFELIGPVFVVRRVMSRILYWTLMESLCTDLLLVEMLLDIVLTAQ